MKHKPMKRNITPEKAQKMLAEMGITISAERASAVLDFMYNLATLEVEQQSNK